ncbi:MAG: hypothetical protein WC638_02160 [Candidatus Paceibacterota bacterium]|jgi:hypothetical protein
MHEQGHVIGFFNSGHALVVVAVAGIKIGSGVGPSHEISLCVEHSISSQEDSSDGQIFKQELSEQFLN